MLSSIFISITVNLRDRLWRRSDKVIQHQKLPASGCQKKPSEELMCQWIGEAWRDIPREMVANSFLKCGITNSLDGSEDDFIFDTSSDDESIVADDSLVSESDFEGF